MDRMSFLQIWGFYFVHVLHLKLRELMNHSKLAAATNLQTKATGTIRLYLVWYKVVVPGQEGASRLAG